MALDFMEQDLLYNLAYDCEGYFDQLLEAFQKAKSEVMAIELCVEFQQRFAIWTAYLGVFARKSQCLDTRLRNLPDLQDLVARLLDILHRSLQHCLTEMVSQREKKLPITSENEYLPEAPQIQMAAFQTIDDTLTRLNRLGITIRQSSSSKIDAKAKKFITGQNMDSFSCLCASAVQALYPDASQSLKDYLSESMTSRYARTSFSSSRNQNLRARREALPTIEERPSNETQTNMHINLPARMAMDPAIPRLQRLSDAPSVSGLSSVDIQHLRSRLRPPDEASTILYKTSSIQVKQGNYPHLPNIDGVDNIIACQWCGEPLNKKKLSETDWR